MAGTRLRIVSYNILPVLGFGLMSRAKLTRQGDLQQKLEMNQVPVKTPS